MVYNKKYYEHNKELFLEWQRQYRKKNHDKILENRRRYDKENRQHQLKLKKQWKLDNKEKVKVQKKKDDAKYYAKMKNVEEFMEKKHNRGKEYYRKNQDKVKAYNKKHMMIPKVKERKLEMGRLWNKNHPEKRLETNKKLLDKLGKPLNLNSLEYQVSLISWTKAVRKQFNDMCQVCFNKADHSHHIIHKAKCPELSLNINNGIPLCKEHHHEAHGQLLIQRGRD